jgi:Concanavalin A-like lectin/glucanases superfamily
MASYQTGSPDATKAAFAVPTGPILLFDGTSTKIEIPSIPDYTLKPSRGMAVSAWIRPDIADFPCSEKGYVHWMGKGEGSGASGQQEWVFRIYNHTNPADVRNKISFYLLNLEGHLGVGSNAHDPIETHVWRHIVGVADSSTTKMFSNGEKKDCDTYQGAGTRECPPFIRDGRQVVITPAAGTAKLRIGTQDGNSYFQGAIGRVHIWKRVLTGGEVTALYERDALPDGDDLVAEFLLDEGSGDRATDSSPLRNHGEITGGTWGMA